VDGRLDVNVALNRPSYQVGTRVVDGIPFLPAYANDGDHGTDMQNGSCAHQTNAKNPWWAVDLGVPLEVHSVKFTNRNSNGSLYFLSTVTSKNTIDGKTSIVIRLRLFVPDCQHSLP